MSSLFANLQRVKIDLVNYLTQINENINWTEFLNKYGTLDDVKILKRIRALSWVDKDLSYDPFTDYFAYYTNLINKFYPAFTKSKISILIPDKNSDIIDEFMIDLEHKVDTLHRLLNIYSIPYEDVSTLSGNEKIVIPTGSITYNDPTKMFENFKGLVIPDDYNNICFKDDDLILNDIILRIESIRKSSLDEKELLAKKYGMLVMTGK